MVFPSKLPVHAALTALVALPFASATHWIFGGSRTIVTTRLDPIVNPGTVSVIFTFNFCQWGEATR